MEKNLELLARNLGVLFYESFCCAKLVLSKCVEKCRRTRAILLAEDTSREDTSREDTSREDTSREDTSREDTSREDARSSRENGEEEQPLTEADVHKEFKRLCLLANKQEIKALMKKYDYLTNNEGLVNASFNGYVELATFFIDNGATNLNECLAISCSNNRYPTAELLAQRGADVIYGIRNTSSPNITAMLHRIQQNTPVIG